MPQILLTFILVSIASAVTPDPKEILERSKEAAGGKAWDKIYNQHRIFEVTYEENGGPFEDWEDFSTSRYKGQGEFMLSKISNGFDGKNMWWQDDSSKKFQVEQFGESNSPESKSCTNRAYKNCLAYWFPERWDAKIEFSGEKEENHKKVYILRIAPKGGSSFDLWVDAKTYLFDRIVEEDDTTHCFSDYRIIDGVKIPFLTTSGKAITRLKTLEFNTKIEGAIFQIPESSVPDFIFSEGKTSTTIPFQLIENKVVIQTTLNGKGPFLMFPDTGGGNTILPRMAADLGLIPKGKLKVRGFGNTREQSLVKINSIQIGDVQLTNQIFSVDPILEENTGGIIGRRIFEKFSMKIDFEKNLFTLQSPSSSISRDDGTVVPFQSSGYTAPVVEGEIDGIKCKFGIDTGNYHSLILNPSFIKTNKLRESYSPKGGIACVNVVRLGDVEIRNVLVSFDFTKNANLAHSAVAGFVGIGILRQFNLTLDYPKQRITLKRNANYGQYLLNNIWAWVQIADTNMLVVDLSARGPAAKAGLKVGDKIIEIDGKSVEKLSSAEKVSLFIKPAGGKLRLTIQSEGQKKEVYFKF